MRMASPAARPICRLLDLGGRGFLVHLGIAVLGAQPEALKELAAGSLALLGPCKVHVKPKMIGLVIGGTEDFLRLCVRVAIPSPLRGPVPTKTRRLTRSGGLKYDFLCNKAANRKVEHIDFRQSQRRDECYRIGAHYLNRGRYLSRATGDAGVVEQDHVAVPGQAVCHCRVPMVHRAGQVLVEDQRQTGGTRTVCRWPRRTASARSGECMQSCQNVLWVGAGSG
jgi:hypothetical protein